MTAMQKNMPAGIEKEKKAKNQLRHEYDYAQEHYAGIAAIWKRDFLNEKEYLAFIRTHSFCPIDEAPLKLHRAIKYLKLLISSHANLMREFEKESTTQLTLPIV